LIQSLLFNCTTNGCHTITTTAYLLFSTQVLAKRAIEELNAEDTPYPGYNNNTNTIHAPHRFSDTANNITIKPSPGINNTNLDSSGTNTDSNTHGLGTLDDSAKLAHLLTTYNQTNTTNTTSTANAGATTTTAPATLFDNTTIHPMHTPNNTPHTTTNTNTNTNTAHNYGAIPFPSSGTSSTNSSTSTTGSATYMLSPSTAHSTVHSAPFITGPLPPLPGQSGAGSAKAGGAGSGIGTGMGSGGVNSDFIDLESSTHALLTPSPPTCSKLPSNDALSPANLTDYSVLFPLYICSVTAFQAPDSGMSMHLLCRHAGIARSQKARHSHASCNAVFHLSLCTHLTTLHTTTTTTTH